jgi:hypothetical protein
VEVKGRPGVEGWSGGGGGRALRLWLEKVVLRGVPMEVLSGLSGLEMDNCRCLRLSEDFLRTCGRGWTLDEVGDPDKAMPSAPVDM